MSYVSYNVICLTCETLSDAIVSDAPLVAVTVY